MTASLTPASAVQSVARTATLTDNSALLWHIRTRGGMPFEVRFYGSGHWCEGDGLTHYYRTREVAEAVASRWINDGRTDAVSSDRKAA